MWHVDFTADGWDTLTLCEESRCGADSINAGVMDDFILHSGILRGITLNFEFFNLCNIKTC